jgi:MFS family permease
LFYGWRMVGVAFGAHFVASGLGFYALSRLQLPLAEAYTDGDRGPIAMIAAVMSLAGFIVSPLVGNLLTKHPLKQMMSASAAVMALGFAIATQATALWHLMVIYGVALPFAVSTMSAIGGNALVANWFDRLRPLAIGIAQFGISIAGAVIAYLISWTLGVGGLSATYAVFAGVALFTAPVLWLTVVDRPSDRGLEPDGDPKEPGETPPQAPPWTLQEALGDLNLWLAGIVAGLCFAGATGMLMNAYGLATDAGYDDTQANSILAIMSVGAAFGKLVFGWLGVRIGEKASLAVAAVGEAICLASLPSATGSFALLATVSLGLGLALGGVMPAMSALLARLYGTHRFSSAMGYVGPVMIPFQMLGAPAAGFVYDQTGSYDLACYAFTVACGLAALLLLRIRVESG